MAYCLGLKVWTTTLPPFGPLPARPATWARSWKVLSTALKSGRFNMVSAEMTPTRVTLGRSSPFNHLSTYKNLDLPPLKGFEGLRMGVPPFHRVTIHPQYLVPGKVAPHLLLNPLRTQPKIIQPCPGALRAILLWLNFIGAVMTNGAMLSLMIRQGYVAPFTSQDVPTPWTAHEGRKTPPVQEEERLLSP